jgi:predicted DCC family thiol-disulfide oxidoreductase YuxK
MKLKIYFDESCGICKKVRRFLSWFDFLKRCEFLFAKDMSFNEDTEAMQNRYVDMYSYDGSNFYKGYDSYMQMFKRMPLFYPMYLLMQISFVRKVGEAYYRKVADSRACKI